MKKIVLAAFFSTCTLMGLAQSELVADSSTPEAAFSWKSGMTFDFGLIAQDQPVSHEFVFTNTGSAPLVIASVKGSCGCTITSYSQGPIEPGATGTVTATYNAKKLGTFTKSVMVNADIGTPVTLYVKGEVVAELK
ncbi:MAG: DUF1573 domain-containing protein [Cyclobacteriaceae bacterium]|nr:DUF1573 domain-containing protein [Cyclobacteriaceae bacterium]